jgi:hypothetical protein
MAAVPATIIRAENMAMYMAVCRGDNEFMIKNIQVFYVKLIIKFFIGVIITLNFLFTKTF